jgi:hypothetical protein
VTFSKGSVLVLRRRLARTRLILIPIAAVVVTWPVLVEAAPAGAQPAVRYVALGDSYSAGLGAGDYSGGSCDRSANAYSALWAAAHARVVVLDYPDPYDLSESSSCPGLSTTDRTDLDQGANELDSQVQAAAARYGDVFADVRAAFAGHEICDSGSWLNSVDWLDLHASYHPTVAGQADGYLPVFTAAAAAG